MDQITVRPAALQDLETLLRFEQGIVAAEQPLDSTLKRGHIHYYDLKEMIGAPHVALVVAELNGAIIGSGYARIEKAKPYVQHERHAYLGFMYTDPRHRGKGVNMKIIEALKAWSISQNITEMRLEVYLSNQPAIKAYEKAGFSSNLLEMRMGLD